MNAQSTRDHMIVGLDKGMRIDGRNLTDYRDIVIETNVSATADGSAKVTIGNTEVIAGVKLALDKPYPDTPDQGNLMVNVELLPLASPRFESGPPSIESIELARVTDRGIRESHMIDLKQLCVEKGEKAWTVIVDICTLNHDGNLFDAANIAALAALRVARFPSVTADGVVDYKKPTKQALPIVKLPVSITVYKVGEHIMLDPTVDEELSADARLTVCSLADGTLCAMQKGGSRSLSVSDVQTMIELALAQAKKSRALVEKQK